MKKKRKAHLYHENIITTSLEIFRKKSNISPLKHENSTNEPNEDWRVVLKNAKLKETKEKNSKNLRNLVKKFLTFIRGNTKRIIEKKI